MFQHHLLILFCPLGCFCTFIKIQYCGSISWLSVLSHWSVCSVSLPIPHSLKYCSYKYVLQQVNGFFFILVLQNYLSYSVSFSSPYIHLGIILCNLYTSLKFWVVITLNLHATLGRVEVLWLERAHLSWTFFCLYPWIFQVVGFCSWGMDEAITPLREVSTMLLRGSYGPFMVYPLLPTL